MATVVVMGGAELVHPHPPPPSEHPVRLAASDLVTFFTAYAFTAFAHTVPNVVLFVLVALWGARVVRGMPARHVLFCLLVAVSGTCWEAMWSGFGFFRYRDPDFLGVPRWLPALYLHAAVAAESARRLLRSPVGAPPRLLENHPNPT
jgi:hypothetical protein